MGDSLFGVSAASLSLAVSSSTNGVNTFLELEKRAYDRIAEQAGEIINAVSIGSYVARFHSSGGGSFISNGGYDTETHDEDVDDQDGQNGSGGSGYLNHSAIITKCGSLRDTARERLLILLFRMMTWPLGINREMPEEEVMHQMLDYIRVKSPKPDENDLDDREFLVRVLGSSDSSEMSGGFRTDLSQSRLSDAAINFPLNALRRADALVEELVGEENGLARKLPQNPAVIRSFLESSSLSKSQATKSATKSESRARSSSDAVTPEIVVPDSPEGQAELEESESDPAFAVKHYYVIVDRNLYENFNDKVNSNLNFDARRNELNGVSGYRVYKRLIEKPGQGGQA